MLASSGIRWTFLSEFVRVRQIFFFMMWSEQVVLLHLTAQLLAFCFLDHRAIGQWNAVRQRITPFDDLQKCLPILTSQSEVYPFPQQSESEDKSGVGSCRQ